MLKKAYCQRKFCELITGFDYGEVLDNEYTECSPQDGSGG